MREIELVLVLLAVSGGLQIMARRFVVPYPSLLVIGGLVIAFIPGLPRIDQSPETLFFIFVPPLLYWTSLTTSYRDLRVLIGPVARLSTGLVLLTMTGVAVTIHALSPEFTWASAFLLGAIVAPPDPIAASAVIRPLGLDRSITTILEGEGLFNDATAFVAYRIALTAVLVGTFSPWHAALRLVVAGVGGIAIGVAAGWLIIRVRKQIGQFPIVENTLSLLSPFIAYVPADTVGASGVLAVVALGLYLQRNATTAMSAATRIQSEAMWTVVTFVLESVIFILIGLELPQVVDALGTHSLALFIGYAVATTVVAILVRFAWITAGTLALRRSRRRAGRALWPQWNEAALVAWAGLRGADSLVIALAIPLATAAGRPFPARDLIVFITFGVIFVTLVMQGLTLTHVVRLLGLPTDQFDRAGEAAARSAEARAALTRLKQLSESGDAPPAVQRKLYHRYALRLKRWSAIRGADAAQSDAAASNEIAWQTASTDYAHIRAQLVEAERRALDQLRHGEKIHDDVLRRLQRELDLETMLMDSSYADEGEGSTESPFEMDDIGE